MDIINTLRNPYTIRKRCRQIFDLAKSDKLKHFQLQADALPSLADYVVDEITSNYPSLDIPYHSRWRHFDVGGLDRIALLNEQMAAASPEEKARRHFELVITSVLLDAGAGDKWHYEDPETGLRFSRSEGLAVASFNMYQKGLFSTASKLTSLTLDDLRACFQVTDLNPLVGLESRLQLLQRLGEIVSTRDIFKANPNRLGSMYDYLASKTVGNKLDATLLLITLLTVLAPIWPGRIRLLGENLGDVWRHTAIIANDGSTGLVPFHKLSQWLCYSLFEPFEMAGFTIVNKEVLTGLPEYRNGGLFIDGNVLRLKDPLALNRSHKPDSELIVEWRALTVCLLDELATLIRKKLNKTTNELPLACILQGGTWSAGRKIAKEKRDNGQPPLQIISDGTVF